MTGVVYFVVPGRAGTKYFVKSVEKRNSYVFYCFCLFFCFVPVRPEVDRVCRGKLLLFDFFLKQLVVGVKNNH